VALSTPRLGGGDRRLHQLDQAGTAPPVAVFGDLGAPSEVQLGLLGAADVNQK